MRLNWQMPLGFRLCKIKTSPRTVMKTLGHSQISLTMNTYAHVLADIERTAMDATAERLFD
jgi:hypothetical protein